MHKVNWKSKKEMIIANAKNDPFLSIEDIAELAKTSSSYVRTILSEANLSLMKLRKEYAKKIEEKNNNLERILFSYLEKSFFNGEEVFLQGGTIINNTQDLSYFSAFNNQNYQHYSFNHLVNQENCCISTIILPNEYSLNKDDKSIKSFTNLLSNKFNDGYLLFSNIYMDIELANPELANLFDEGQFIPIFAVKQYIIKNKDYIGLMVLYFNNRRVSLALNEKKGLTIMLKN